MVRDVPVDALTRLSTDDSRLEALTIFLHATRFLAGTTLMWLNQVFLSHRLCFPIVGTWLYDWQQLYRWSLYFVLVVVEAFETVTVLVAELLIGVALAVEFDAFAVFAIACFDCLKHWKMIFYMDFYYEVGSRPALKILLLLEFLPTHNINLKDIGELENR